MPKMINDTWNYVTDKTAQTWNYIVKASVKAWDYTLNSATKAWRYTVDTTTNAWNQAVDTTKRNWLQISLGSIFSLALATFNVVFPPAMFPTLVTLSTLFIGTGLYFVGKAVVSYFKKDTSVEDHDAPVCVQRQTENPSSTEIMSRALEAHKTTDLVQAPTSTTGQPVVDTSSANEANMDEELLEITSSFRM